MSYGEFCSSLATWNASKVSSNSGVVVYHNDNIIVLIVPLYISLGFHHSDMKKRRGGHSFDFQPSYKIFKKGSEGR